MNHRERLEMLACEGKDSLSKTFIAREHALHHSRKVIQCSANTIRAIHRAEFVLAQELIESAKAHLEQAADRLVDHPSVFYAGFLEDAQKEFAEAHVTMAIVLGQQIPGPTELGIGFAPYFNGLAESIGEMRRYVLDALRRSEINHCEQILETMDDVYAILTTMDFPDAITRGLRRNTDSVRGILERTRGDLTIAVLQHNFGAQLKSKGISDQN